MNITKGLTLGVIILNACNFQTASTGNNEQPNLIFVFTDQQSWDMLGCYGNEQIITPHLDNFAAQGVQFNHCISNTPVCSPYRGMLLSGQHPLYNGTLHNDIQMLAGNGNYFAEVLRDHGYRTGYYGKWHLYGGDRVRPIPPGPYRYGFDYEFLSNNCTLLYDSLRSYFWNDTGLKEFYGDWEWNAQTNQALEFIDNHADKPMALFLSWHAPHDWNARGIGLDHKYAAPPELEALYDPETILLRGNCEDTPLRRKFYQGHMAMITSLDRDFGYILEKLEEKGIADNSIIIFTSDHGDMLESHGWPFNKGRPEMESIRVPLLMKWGNQLTARKSDLLVGTLDLMPTILSLMNLPVPESCHGIDLSGAIIQGDDNAVESVPLFYFAGDWRGVYTHDHTYAFSLESGEAEPHAIAHGFRNYNVLYEHHNDPFQLNNHFDNEEYAGQKAKLHQLSLEWMERYNDRGTAFQELLPLVMQKEDYTYFINKRAAQTSGIEWDTRLKGRPVDFQP